MSQVVAAVDHRFPDLDLERQVLEPLDVELRDAKGMSRSEALAACATADAIMVGARFSVDAEAFAAMPSCREVVRYGVGVDNVDVPAATRAGAWVVCVPDYCIEEVADHALALVLALNRRTKDFDTAVRDGQWGIPPGLPVRRLSSCTLGLIGFGRIGEALGRRAAALGMRVVAHDPVRDPAGIRAAGAEPAALEEVLRRADYVSLHMPGDGGTPVLDAARLRLMKPSAALINVARGGLVDETALIGALRSGALAGAALDVASAEPLVPPHPLLEAPNVLLSPHAAWYSLEAVRDLRTKAAEEVARVLRGEAPLHAVNDPTVGGPAMDADVSADDLAAELSARFEQALGTRSPRENKMMDELIADLRRRGSAGAPTRGTLAPDFALPDQHGRTVSLGESLRRGAVVLVFYRGGWCPYCNLQLRAYQAVLDEVHALGAEMIAVSPQLPDSSLSTAEKDTLTFPVLSDVGSRTARDYGLVFEVPEEVVTFYRERKGFELGDINGRLSPELPVPACFIIEGQGRVVLAHVDPDYTKRLEPRVIIEVLRRCSRFRAN